MSTASTGQTLTPEAKQAMREFFNIVLADTGIYCAAIHVKKDPKDKGYWMHYPEATIDALIDRVDQLSMEGKNVYFANATLKAPKVLNPKTEKHEVRTLPNLSHLKTIFIDIDVGTEEAGKLKYATQKEALEALKQFCGDVGLPLPMAVLSGSGVHAYWPLSESVPVAEWVSVAARFKKLVTQRRFKADPKVTGDAARVLRPVGTLNFKTDPPGQVRKLVDAKRVMTLAEFAEIVDKATPVTDSKVLATMPNNTAQTYPDKNIDLIYQQCQQLADCLETGGPVGYARREDWVSIIKHCENPDYSVLLENDKDPDKVQQQTEQMLSTSTSDSPHLCTTFEANNHGGCDGCQHHGKDGFSPITLGIKRQGGLVGFVNYPVTNSKNEPRIVQENTSAVMKASNVTIRYNVIRKDIEVNIPGHKGTIDNHNEVSFGKALDLCHLRGYSISVDSLRRHVLAIGDAAAYNPFAVWVLMRPWDGVDRLQTFYNSLVTVKDDKGNNDRIKRRGMLRFAMTVLAAGFNNEGIEGGGISLVLVGGQGVGKSYWCSRLTPKHRGWFKDGAVNPDDKDSVSTAISYLIFELAELDGVFRKADVASLKAFLSRDTDRFRRPYASTDSIFARRTAFIASVNHKEFLVDETGNRRYWSIEVTGVNQLPDDDDWKQQMWAQFYEQHYLKGERWNLNEEEIRVINSHNKAFSAPDPTEDRMLTRFAFDAELTNWKDWRTASQICDLLGMPADLKNTRRIAAIIRAQFANKPGTAGGTCEKRTNQGRQLLCPPLREGTW